MKTYLLITLGVYIGFFTANFHMFKNATIKGILRGLVGVLVWPIIVPMLLKEKIDAVRQVR